MLNVYTPNADGADVMQHPENLVPRVTEKADGEGRSG